MHVAKVLSAADKPIGESRDDLLAAMGISHCEHFRKTYFDPLLAAGWLERTSPGTLFFANATEDKLDAPTVNKGKRNSGSKRRNSVDQLFPRFVVYVEIFCQVLL